MGVISNSDFGDADDNWIYDKYPTTENATTNLNLYAKWTPLKTHIILDASGASNGTDGEAWVEYDNTTLTSFTSVVPVPTKTKVRGYYTEPENHGTNNGIMVLTSTGDFAVDLDGTTLGVYIRDDGGKNKWYKYNTESEDTPLEIKLYAHYVIDPELLVKGDTRVTIDYNMEGIYGSFTGADLQIVNVTYGAEKISVHSPVNDLGLYLIGLYADEACNFRVAYDDGRIVAETDVPNYTKGGKWICEQSEVKLYTKWSLVKPEPNECTIMFFANGGAGYMETQKISVPCSSNVAVTANSFAAPSGKVFIGWNSRPDGTGLWYYDCYSSNKWTKTTIMLYAQWETSGKLSTNLYEPVNYVKMRDGGQTYINLGNPSEPFCDLRFYNTYVPITGFWFGADDYNNIPCTRFCGAIYSTSMWFAAGADGDGTAWNNRYLFVNEISCTKEVAFARFYAGNGVFGGAIEKDAPITILSPYIGDFRCGYDWLLFGAMRKGVYNENAMGNRANARCGGVTWVKSDGTEWFHLIPCRLKTNITADKAKDGLEHSAGEIGLWDFVTDKFYAKSSGAAFTCELD